MKHIKPYQALITIVLIIAVMFICIVGLHISTHVPLIIGCVIAGTMAKLGGNRWEEILEAIVSGISGSLEAILILLSIGMMMGAWITCGTVPTIVYYGLQLMNAKTFLVATFLLCGAVSMVVGAWGTAGTIGLAFVAIGIAMGLPSPVTAGAIVSGAYVGDKLSPISDATNLAAASARCDVMKNVRQMIPIAAVSCLAAAGLYLAIGLSYGGNDEIIRNSVSPIISTLSENFRVSLLGLLPLAVLVVCILCKVPALVSILAGTFSGTLLAVAWQGAELAGVFTCLYAGFVAETGNTMVDGLLTTGGIQSMLDTVSIILLAMALGGIMQGTGHMAMLVNPIAQKVKSSTGLAASTILCCLFCNIVLPDQYLGISIPGQIFRGEYERRGIKNETLANVLGAGGAVTSPLVPWNTCGVYMSSILAATTAQYLPYCFFCLILPFVMLGYVFLLGRKDRAADRSSAS